MKMFLKRNIYPTALARPRKHGFVEHFLDQSQARGELIVSADQLARAGQVTHVAVRRQLEHLSQRVQYPPRRPSTYLIAPPEHLARGAPPVAARWAWADHLPHISSQDILYDGR
jgi:hypothetical protein